MKTARLFGVAAAIATLAATLAAPALGQDKKTLVISLWGFNGDKIEEFIFKPFREKHNVDIVLETGNNADRLNKLKIRGGAGADLIYLTDAYSQIGAEEGLFQPVDKSKIPNLEGAYDIAKNPQGEDMGPAYTVGRIGIVYDADKVEPITDWSDLWREDLEGKVSIPNITTTAGPMVVMIAGEKAGVDAFENPDAAFAEMEALKPNVVKSYRTGSELVNLFSTGEVSVAVVQDFAFGRLKEAVPGATWADLEGGDFSTLNTINIPKGAENVELAHEYINWILDPELQKTLAENGVDAPIVKSVELSDEAAAGWTYGSDMIDSLKGVDYARMNAAKAEWTDRWNEIFGQ